LKGIKSTTPDIHTIIGGPHASALPQETLSSNGDCLDFLVFGEGEQSCLDIIEQLEGERFPSSPLPGVIFRDPLGKTFVGPSRPLAKDLSLFDFPARHLFPMDRYVDLTKFKNELYAMITTSRGCPSSCTFCGSQTTWGRFTRFRSSESVLSEIHQCIEQYQIKNFIFCDDTFTLRKDQTIDICKKITELPDRINIFCSSRIDTLTEDRLEWLKKAGCYCLTFGIESGNNEILKLMRKGITVEQVRKSVALTKAAGIEVHGSFIIGNLGDTEETIKQTIELAIELNLDQVQFSILVPLPGTECFQMADKKKAFRCSPGNFESFYWYYSVAANLTEIPDEHLVELEKMAYERWNASKTMNQ
jgi:anaerobic magnesium-protoporphyrin IX monomethyl ester cyclase